MTPAEKLARSRLAIIEQLQGREPRRETRQAQPGQESPGQEPPQAEGPRIGAERARRPRRGGWFAGMSGAARAWWLHHPAQMALEMVTPMLQSQLRKRPFQVMGLAVGVGALLVVTRPWRVLSLTTVVVAVLKSSQLSGVLMSALADAQGDGQDWQDQQPGSDTQR